MMELPRNLIPPHEAWQVLCEAPGVIWQFQLRSCNELREQLLKEDSDIRGALAALKTLADFVEQDDLATPETLEALERHVMQACQSAVTAEKISCLRRLFSAFTEALKDRFRAGYLIEMGLFTMYRDHTGAVVLAEDPFHPWDFN